MDLGSGRSEEEAVGMIWKYVTLPKGLGQIKEQQGRLQIFREPQEFEAATEWVRDNVSCK